MAVMSFSSCQQLFKKKKKECKLCKTVCSTQSVNLEPEPPHQAWLSGTRYRIKCTRYIFF